MREERRTSRLKVSEGTGMEKQLMESILNIKYEDIPQKDIENAKISVIDTLGVIVAGTRFPGVEKLKDQLTNWGGKRESTIMGFGNKVPATSAALINGTMARALDFDETHEEAVVHPAASIVPGCLSIAERKGNVGGKEFLAAVALGRDLVCRLALAPTRGPLLSGWQPSATLGCLGVAAATSKISGLDIEEALNAWGIAYSHCSGNMQGFTEGAFTGAMQQGIAASAGVFATIMAERGISGAHEILEGHYGYFRVYENSKYDRNQLIQDFAEPFEGSNVTFKLYPCCRFAHGAIDIVLQTVRLKKLRPRDVDQIEVRVNKQAVNMVGRPLKKKQIPSTIVDAKFSIPFTLAVAMTKGRVTIEDFSERNIADPGILEMSQKVTVVLDEKIEKEFGRTVGPAIINFKLKNGGVISAQSEFYKKEKDHSKWREQIHHKFGNCLKNGLKPFKESSIERIGQTLENLECLDNVGDVVELLNFNS